MLLLYQGHIQGEGWKDYFTFHYASTISCPSSWAITRLFSFTFHYASTISRPHRRQQSRTYNFTFHYASTISTLPKRSVALEGSLYIPLCFYYIYIPSYSSWSSIMLYIPLCFYYIGLVYIGGLPGVLTLHSTMLLLYQRTVLNDIYKANNFTFHYASTISRFLGGTPGVYPPLHSTMLLLYRTTSAFYSKQSCLYIPLCFYYIKWIARSLKN